MTANGQIFVGSLTFRELGFGISEKVEERWTLAVFSLSRLRKPVSFLTSCYRRVAFLSKNPYSLTTLLRTEGAVCYGCSESITGPCSRTEILGICETGGEVVVPFSPVSCSNTSSCRDRASAEPDVAFEQGGLNLVWRHCCPSGAPGKSPFLMYALVGILWHVW